MIYKEVDFICNKGSKRFYIQSAYALSYKENVNVRAATKDKELRIISYVL